MTVGILHCLRTLCKICDGVKKSLFNYKKQESNWGPRGEWDWFRDRLGTLAFSYDPLGFVCERASVQFECWLIYGSQCESQLTNFQNEHFGVTNRPIESSQQVLEGSRSLWGPLRTPRVRWKAKRYPKNPTHLTIHPKHWKSLSYSHNQVCFSVWKT